jgi:cyclase
MGPVKGVGFNSWRRTGSTLQAIKVYNMRGVDELVFFEIAASPEDEAPDYDQIYDLADECFMPMTVGGGIRSVEDIGTMLGVGAGKVSINSQAVLDAGLIADVAKNFGNQCIVVAIDARRHRDGALEVLTHGGERSTGLDLEE